MLKVDNHLLTHHIHYLKLDAVNVSLLVIYFGGLVTAAALYNFLYLHMIVIISEWIDLMIFLYLATLVICRS